MSATRPTTDRILFNHGNCALVRSVNEYRHAMSYDCTPNNCYAAFNEEQDCFIADQRNVLYSGQRVSVDVNVDVLLPT